MSLFGHLGCFGGLQASAGERKAGAGWFWESKLLALPILTRCEAISACPREEKAPTGSKGRRDQTGIGYFSLGQFLPRAILYHPFMPLWHRPSHKEAKRTENQVSSPNQAGAKSLREERLGSTDQHTPSTGLPEGKNGMGGGSKVSQKQLEGWFGEKIKG